MISSGIHRALLIIDEAQDLAASALEELRLLTNLQQDNQPLLQIFLLGQENLKEVIHRQSMEQVHQRLVAACHLEPLSKTDSKAYIQHRLSQVNWQNNPAISEPIYAIIHKYGGGIPRRINLICSRLFLHGCVEELHQISMADAKIVINELRQEQLMSNDFYSDMDFNQPDHYETVHELPPSEPKNQQTNSSQQIKIQTAFAEPTRPAVAALHTKAKPSCLSESAVPPPEQCSSQNKSTGLESRKGPRRKGEERRESVRFQPNKDDPRAIPGRRKGDLKGHIWD